MSALRCNFITEYILYVIAPWIRVVFAAVHPDECYRAEVVVHPALTNDLREFRLVRCLDPWPCFFSCIPLSVRHFFEELMTQPKYIVTNANSLSWQKLEKYSGVEIKSLGTASGQWLEPGWSSIGETGTVDSDFLSGDKGCMLLAVYTPPDSASNI